MTGRRLPPQPSVIAKYRDAMEQAEELWRQQMEDEEAARRATDGRAPKKAPDS